MALVLLVFAGTSSHADTPVTLFESLAGNINITGTGGTLRTLPDGPQGSPNQCQVTNSGSMQLSGIPAGTTVRTAYLYWAGSGGDPQGGVPADYDVTFNGTPVTADREYTASYDYFGTLYFFGGVADVTSLVTGNGTYTFADLTVQTTDVAGGGQYCYYAAVLSAFSLLVIYEDPAETLHVVNLWEGFQTYRAASITLTPSNFIVPTPAPTTPLNSRILVLTWEGDSGNSQSSGGFTETLTFCSPAPCAGTALTDAYNPLNNQFNSTVDMPPNGPFSGINTTWGLDLDLYDLTSRLPAGAGSAQSVYSSGQDLVILMNQTMSIANVPVADLAIIKSHVGNFTVGTNGVYMLRVSNNGPNDATGTITVTDTLPSGLTYVSATGTGWTCGAAGQTVTCTRPGPLANGATAPDIALTVAVGATAYPSVTNTVSVTSDSFDNISANNTDDDPTTVIWLGTGNKPLYLYGAPGLQLSRTPTPGVPGAITLIEGNSRTWTLDPPLQLNSTIDPAINATVPVALYLARSNNTSQRYVTASLACSAGGTTLSQQLNPALTTTPALVTFNLPLAAAQTCPTGSRWQLTVRNDSSGFGARNVLVYPVYAGNISQVVLPTTTVINVDSIDFYDAAFPGGSLIGSVAPGSSLSIRAIVSDPFGSFDINANPPGTLPTITIRDPGGNIIVNAAATSEVADSGAATKTFEYAYTVPAGGPAGNWTVRVDAEEGTEGTVGDFLLVTLPVVAPPSLTVLKSASGPTARPGDVITYTVQVLNAGSGAAANVVLTDQMSPYTAWQLDFLNDGAPEEPFSFAGAGSGLTLGTPDYSRNGGTTWGQTPLSGNGGAPAGYDGTITNWRIPMTGTMTAGGSFTLRYRVLVK